MVNKTKRISKPQGQRGVEEARPPTQARSRPDDAVAAAAQLPLPPPPSAAAAAKRRDDRRGGQQRRSRDHILEGAVRVDVERQGKRVGKARAGLFFFYFFCKCFF